MVDKQIDGQLFQNILDEEYLNFDARLESDVERLLLRNELNVALAESVTGGLVGYRLVCRPGASRYFLGGVTCYNTGLKMKLCRVKPETVRQHGVVSTDVALEMAHGVRTLMNSDIGVSTTGEAGPVASSQDNDDVGRVCVSVVTDHHDQSQEYQFRGSRSIVLYDTVRVVFSMLRDCVRQLERRK